MPEDGVYYNSDQQEVEVTDSPSDWTVSNRFAKVEWMTIMFHKKGWLVSATVLSRIGGRNPGNKKQRSATIYTSDLQ